MGENEYFRQFSGYEDTEPCGYVFRYKPTGYVFESLFNPAMEKRGWTLGTWTVFQLKYDEDIDATVDDLERVYV